MLIIFDTNIIVSDFQMKGTNFQVLFENVRRTGDRLAIPQIVIDEVLNKFKEKIKEHQINLDKNKNEVKRFTGRDLPITITPELSEELLEEYNVYLNGVIQEKTITILPYPQVPHEYLTKKAIEKKKPFSEKGNGYRDSLIWETIKNCLSRRTEHLFMPEAVLLTNNHHDFGKEEDQLHSDLKDELDKEGYYSDAVHVYNALNSLISKKVKPTLELLQNLQTRIENNEFENLNLKASISNYLTSILNDEIDSYLLDLPSNFESTSISTFEEDFDVQIIDVLRLSNQSLLISVKAEVYCEIDFFIYKSEYWGLNETDIYVVDEDWNNHYVYASKSKELSFHFNLIVSGNMEVQTIDLNKINENYISIGD